MSCPTSGESASLIVPRPGRRGTTQLYDVRSEALDAVSIMLDGTDALVFLTTQRGYGASRRVVQPCQLVGRSRNEGATVKSTPNHYCHPIVYFDYRKPTRSDIALTDVPIPIRLLSAIQPRAVVLHSEGTNDTRIVPVFVGPACETVVQITEQGDQGTNADLLRMFVRNCRATAEEPIVMPSELVHLYRGDAPSSDCVSEIVHLLGQTVKSGQLITLAIDSSNHSGPTLGLGSELVEGTKEAIMKKFASDFAPLRHLESSARAQLLSDTEKRLDVCLVDEPDEHYGEFLRIHQEAQRYRKTTDQQREK